MTVCIVDTSVLDELLNVPGWANKHAELLELFAIRQSANERFLLPLAVLFETGNHVAQVNDGGVRRKKAAHFVTFAHAALEGRSPFVPTLFPSSAAVVTWLDGFPDFAMRGIGLADRSLIALWEEQRELHPQQRVYIWSLDAQLTGYDTGAR